jgi:hypothetical protein
MRFVEQFHEVTLAMVLRILNELLQKAAVMHLKRDGPSGSRILKKTQFGTKAA